MEKQEVYRLRFKWTVSRGRDTYGYNICSLYVDGTKVSACNGGGYDMKGTSFGNWLAAAFAENLRKLTEPFYGLTFHDPTFDPGKADVEGETVEQREKEGKSIGLERYQAFYGASAKLPSERHHVPLIDGACGFSQVQKIAKAIGFAVRYVDDPDKNTQLWLMERS